MKAYYSVRYLGKIVKVIQAHSKWQAMDEIYTSNAIAHPHILRKSFTATKSNL